MARSDAVAGAMEAKEKSEPMGYAIGRDEAGRPLYLVAVILGPENINATARALDAMRGNYAKVAELSEPPQGVTGDG